MPNLNQSFQGQTLILPGAYYADDVSAGVPSVPPTTPPVIFIGYGYGQKPQTAITYVTPQDLKAAIRGGPCSGFVDFLTNGSNEFAGAQQITYINVGENTQSTLSVSNGSSGIALLTSANYGTPSNLLQWKVETGTTGGKKVTIFDGYANTSQVQDNVGLPFQLAYIGTAASGVTYTVNTSGLTASSFVVSSPNQGESFTMQIGAGQYTSVEQIVEFLNGTGFYSAVPIGDATMPAASLDAAAGITLNKPVAGVNQYVNVTAALGAVVYFVGQYASTMATIAVSGTVTQFTSGLAPQNTPFVNFSGAVSVPPVNNDYATALNLALTIPGFCVFCDSNMSAVQALLAQHVVTASQITNGKWRRGFTGSSVGDAVAVATAAAQSLNAKEMMYFYPGIYRTDPVTGKNTLYGGLYAAAAACGIAAGNIVALPLTNKTLVGNGVETTLSVSQINQLQQAGVAPIYGSSPPAVGQSVAAVTPQPPTIVSDITTWQNDNNPLNCLSQSVGCRQYLAYSLQNAVQPYVGTIAAPITLVAIRKAITATLNALVYTKGNNGVLAAWDPASIVMTYNGQSQTLSIQLSVVLVGQNRFITMFVPIQPLQLTISAQSIVPFE